MKKRKILQTIVAVCIIIGVIEKEKVKINEGKNKKRKNILRITV